MAKTPESPLEPFKRAVANAARSLAETPDLEIVYSGEGPQLVGKRAVLPHARVVLHQPAGQGRGAIPDLILQADELVRVRGEVEEILARHTGQDAAKLRSDTDRDRVFTAAEAVVYGLADRVLERG